MREMVVGFSGAALHEPITRIRDTLTMRYTNIKGRTKCSCRESKGAKRKYMSKFWQWSDVVGNGQILEHVREILWAGATAAAPWNFLMYGISFPIFGPMALITIVFITVGNITSNRHLFFVFLTWNISATSIFSTLTAVPLSRVSPVKNHALRSQHLAKHCRWGRFSASAKRADHLVKYCRWGLF